MLTELLNVIESSGDGAEPAMLTQQPGLIPHTMLLNQQNVHFTIVTDRKSHADILLKELRYTVKQNSFSH